MPFVGKNQQGRPAVYYEDDLPRDNAGQVIVPSGAVEISEENLRTYYSDPGRYTLANLRLEEVVVSIEDRRASKESEIRAQGARQLAQLAAPYGSSERETWDTQQREARGYDADPSAATPMLSAMAAARGVTLEEMVAKVLENVAMFEAAAGEILGRQQALLDQLVAAEDAVEIEAIAW